MVASSAAQTFTSLLSFLGTNGSLPIGPLVQGLDGNFYGTTRTGGTNDAGTVFRVTPEGQQTTLHSFDGSDGEYPYGLALATDGNFYGTTQTLGPNGHGTVFKITSGGTLTTIYSFCAEGGECAETGTFGTGIIQGHDGNLYGTTFGGGADGDGILYKLSLAGAFTALASFDSTDGFNPFAALVQDTAGDFWGAAFGGTSNDGAVFKYSSGALTTVVSFDGSDGDFPAEYGALVQTQAGTSTA
jgi:uncharacterized repeat protein (TIGR03803 family)